MPSLLSPLRLPPPPPPRPSSSSPAAPTPNVYAAFRRSTASPASHFAQSLVGWPILSLSPTTGRCGFSESRGGRCVVPLAMSAAASGDSDGSTRLSMDAIRKLFDGFPQPVKSFPWMRVLWSFRNIIWELVWAVVKYLGVPILAVTSLSEMSYCAHERKMGVIPIPVVVGFAVAGCLNDVAEQFSSYLKEGGLPWHLLLIASFFTLLKLPGPYYPYWGRLLIPHLANGGLSRTIWLIFMWYRRPNAVPGASL